MMQRNRWDTTSTDGRYEAAKENYGRTPGTTDSEWFKGAYNHKEKDLTENEVPKVIKSEYVPLSVCGYCGIDTKDNYKNRTEKVIEFDFSNMLCGDCRKKMYDELALIAMKYLCK